MKLRMLVDLILILACLGGTLVVTACLLAGRRADKRMEQFHHARN